MDRKIVLMAVIVAASGCAQTDIPGNTNTAPSGNSGQGLQVSTFDVSDDTVSPGQNAIVTVELANYHTQDISVNDISIYNTGFLNVERSGCSPSELRPARDDYTPRMECTWRISVPEGGIEGFESRTIPIKLNLVYDSQLSNSQSPVKAHFSPIEEIETTDTVQASFSNSEVSMNIEMERPIPYEGRTVTVTAANAGNGRVDSNFVFSYFPEEVFQNCGDPEKEPVVGQEVQFTCDIVPQSEVKQTRNLIFSTSYKYVKSPTLDIEVVDAS